MATRPDPQSGPKGYTIGEVLNQVKEEFEDITISKIRFLENEGLLYPDRTESGYRIFSDDDVDRLRFILTAQRDHYLPLKVIREQLDRLDAGESDDDTVTSLRAAPSPSSSDERAGALATDQHSAARTSAEQIAQAVEAAAGATDAALLDPPTSVEMTLRDFTEATGLSPSAIKSLRDYGILGDPADPNTLFDADDLIVARAARELLQMGLEPRHLRMYRQFVEREVALFEQLATPMLRQRNPEARRQATRQLEKLSTLTSRMKRSLLSRALRQYVRGS